MAGTIVASTLSDGTNSTSTTNPIRGSARAWVQFNGTGNPAVVNASYNVSSITYVSSGTYTINFTNAFPNIYYSIIGSANCTGSQAVMVSPNSNGSYQASAPTTTASTVQITSYTAPAASAYVNIAVFSS